MITHRIQEQIKKEKAALEQSKKNEKASDT
jgi:hypothetical protein